MAIEKVAIGLIKSPACKKMGAILKRTSYGTKKTLTNKKNAPKQKFPTTVKELLAPMNMILEGKALMVLTDDFALKKQNLVRELSNVCDTKTIEHIKACQTPKQLAKILVKQETNVMQNFAQFCFDNKFAKSIFTTGLFSKSALPLELEQFMYKQMAKRSEFILAREKAMHVSSKNPQVIAIENILKEQYGCKFVSLKDNEVLAKRVLKAYETAAKNGVKTPQNIALSDFILDLGENFSDTILLRSTRSILPRGWLSTAVDFHIQLHEIMHGVHPELLSYSYKKIPKEFLQVKRNLSGYSAQGATQETFTELNTKRLIDGLTPQEQALYNYLNIYS